THSGSGPAASRNCGATRKHPRTAHWRPLPPRRLALACGRMGSGIRIGVDVGGTNTDAVLMEGTTVRASCKSPTSANVSDGIAGAIRGVLDASGTAPAAVRAVMLGTTHFTNAFVERRNLLEVGVLRLALPATRGLPPMVDWPEDLAAVIGR